MEKQEQVRLRDLADDNRVTVAVREFTGRAANTIRPTGVLIGHGRLPRTATPYFVRVHHVDLHTGSPFDVLALAWSEEACLHQGCPMCCRIILPGAPYLTVTKHQINGGSAPSWSLFKHWNVIRRPSMQNCVQDEAPTTAGTLA
jgi:hypothetical protein